MSWTMHFDRVVSNEAEIFVHVDYYAGDDIFSNLVHHEQATFEAGTPRRKIVEEMAKRGRAFRESLGAQAEPHPLLGEVMQIDDV